MTTLLLPPELLGADLRILALRHPRTGAPTKFAVAAGLTKVWQLLTVDQEAHPKAVQRSLLLVKNAGADVQDKGDVNEGAIGAGNLTALVPVHPSLLLLPALLAQAGAPLPLDVLLEFSADDDTEPLPTNIAAEYLPRVCTVSGEGDDALYELSPTKLDAFFDKIMTTTIPHLPTVFLAPFLRAVTPLDPSVALDPALDSQVRRYAAFRFIASWLNDAALTRAETALNFTALHAEVGRLQAARAQALAVQQLTRGAPAAPAAAAGSNKRKAAPALSAKAAKAKLAAASNRSVLDMFKQVPTKAKS